MRAFAPPSLRMSVAFLLAGLAAAIIAALFVFSNAAQERSAQTIDDSAFGAPSPVFRIVAFDDLPGWREDDPGAALPALLTSCVRLLARAPDAPANALENLGPDFDGWSLAGRVGDWTQACESAAAIEGGSEGTPAEGAARAYFERHFRPVQIIESRAALADGPAGGAPPRIAEHGVFTGYFEPSYAARRAGDATFSAPVYARPDDLIDVELGAFRSSLAGDRVAGRLEGRRLVPYADRRAINAGALQTRAEILAWMRPDDLFFLQIQGSGQLVLPDNTIWRIGYDGANGRDYTAIGRILVERGEMDLADASMQSIRAWLDGASPAAAQALREENASFVFFRKLDPPPEGFGPPGAQGAPLLAERSLAVDRRFHALGAPVYVDIEPSSATDAQPFRRLMIAQDTGGAIRGPIRGDVFWGAGADAANRAGAMNAKGRMFILLPKARVDALAARIAGHEARAS